MYLIKFHYKEKPFSCGPCALRMIIESFFNIEIEEEIIIKLIGATEKEGTPLALFKKNLSFSLEQICLQINRVNQFTFHIEENSNFNEIQTFQKAGYLIMLNYKKPDGQSHWAVLYQINEDFISQHLMTRGLVDPDLIIRTSGESRLSNFLMWQASYSELFFSSVLWPDYTTENFDQACHNYYQRERRFGKVLRKNEESFT